jgi:alpha,alpha-trehalase
MRAVAACSPRLARWALSGVLLASIVSLTPAMASSQAPRPQSPYELFGDLFAAVQNADIFKDKKGFADAVPKAAPAIILKRYHAKAPLSPAALRKFVLANFTLPTNIAAPAKPMHVKLLPIRAHINSLWDHLTRTTKTVPPYSSLLALPYPYVVPGGRFREMYYWDSYFTMLGLAESGRTDLIKDMVGDFAYLIDTYGHIPNGNRTYYLTRSQPPFFFKMVALLNPKHPGKAFGEYLPELKKEYAFWMQGEASLTPWAAHRNVVELAGGAILNRYWGGAASPRDESYEQDYRLARSVNRPPAEIYRNIRAAAESGWDFSSRWFADSHSMKTIDTTEIIPVDLNSLLYGLENAIRLGCKDKGDTACATEFAERAAKRRAAMDHYLWDAKDGTWRDYRWTRKAQTAEITAASLYPLFFGVTTEAQARAVAKATAKDLLKKGGLATTQIHTGQQWDAPNGWAPLQWIAVAGLARYHERKLAQTIACRWMVGVHNVYRQTGKLVEKYNVSSPNHGGGGGEYPLQDGFGWTNGVMMRLMADYPKYVDYTSIKQCPKGEGVKK